MYRTPLTQILRNPNVLALSLMATQLGIVTPFRWYSSEGANAPKMGIVILRITEILALGRNAYSTLQKFRPFFLYLDLQGKCTEK